MKTQNLKINHAQIKRKSSYGHYKIVVFFTIENEDFDFSFSTTDSQLFDAVHGEENEFHALMENASSLIEREVDNYLNTL